MPGNAEIRKNSNSSEGLIDAVWRFFSSVRLALILILILAILGLLGALLVQAPTSVVSDKLVYQAWLAQVAEPKYGLWTPLLSLFRLFDMFHSPWFLGAGILLVINILVCSVNRWQSLRLAVSGGAIKLGDSFYSSGSLHGELNASSNSPQNAIDRVLRRRHYRVRTEQHQDKVYLAADKNGIFRLGTYVSHLSLILFIIGFLIGSYFGFRNTEFVVAEGARQEVGYDTNLSLYLESFVDEYYDDGAPKDYRSQVKLYENGMEVRSTVIRVNHPLAYNGVRFYQSFFGPVVKMQVRNSDGTLLLDDSVLMTQVLQAHTARYNAGEFELPQTGVTGRVIKPATDTDDPIIGKDELAVELSQGGQAISMNKIARGEANFIGELEFTYLEDARYSGFQVSRDPGNAIIWIASTLFVLSVCVVLYFPYRQTWMLVQPMKGGSRINIRSLAPRSFNADEEFKSLMSEIQNELSEKKKRQS